MCYFTLHIAYLMSQCFPSVPLRSNNHLQGCKKRHQPIITTETPFLWMRKLPPSERPSPKRDIFLLNRKKYNKRLLGTLPQSQWHLLLKEEQAPPPPLGPRRSQRKGKVPEKPENVYGHCHPVEILKDP